MDGWFRSETHSFILKGCGQQTNIQFNFKVFQKKSSALAAGSNGCPLLNMDLSVRVACLSDEVLAVVSHRNSP